MKIEEKWGNFVKEAINSNSSDVKIQTILLDNVAINEMFFPLQILPSRNKPLSKWQDQDEAWERIVTQFQREIIKINEKKQSNGI